MNTQSAIAKPGRKRAFTPMAITLVCVVLAPACAVQSAHVTSIPAAPLPPEPQDPPALVIPQTVLQLPDPQPIPEGAVPIRELQPAVASSPDLAAPSRPARRTGSAASAKPRNPGSSPGDVANVTASELPPPAEASPVDPGPADTSSRVTAPPFTPADGTLPSAEEIRKRINEVRDMDNRIKNRNVSDDALVTHRRILDFLDLASQALQRKDLRQADSLAHRAKVLAEDILGAR